MTKKSDAPAIRFKGFSDAWEQRKLGELALFNPKDELPQTFEYVDLESVVGTEMLSHRTEVKSSAPSRAQRLAHTGDLFYQTVRPYQKNNYLFEKPDNNYVFSTGYAQMRPYVDGYFLLSLVQSERFVKVVLDNCTGTSYPAINANDLAEIEVAAPSDESEAQRIGTIFRSIDNLITLHQRQPFLHSPPDISLIVQLTPPFYTFSWEQRKLEDYLTVSAEKNTGNIYGRSDVLSVSGDYGIVNQIEFQGRSFAGASVSNYGVVQTGDVVYTKSPLNSNPYGIIKTNKGKPGIVSTLYAVYHPKENAFSDFIQVYFEQHARMNNYMHPLVNKGAKNDMKVSAENALKGPVCFPSRIEQESISAFFSVLDNLITLHQRQPFLHSPPDISLIVQLTPPFYTFSWEQRKLSEMCGTFEYGLNAAAKEFDGKNKYIRITDIDDVSREFLLSDLSSPDICLDGMSKYLLSSGDVVFARTGASVGKTYIYRENDGIVYFAGFLIRAKVNQDNDAEFVFQSTLSPSYEKYIRITSQRSGQPGVNAQEYSEYDLFAPSKEEQQRIGHFLRGIDHLITLHQRQTIVYAVIRSIRKVILAERQYFAPPMVRKSP